MWKWLFLIIRSLLFNILIPPRELSLFSLSKLARVAPKSPPPPPPLVLQRKTYPAFNSQELCQETLVNWAKTCFASNTGKHASSPDSSSSSKNIGAFLFFTVSKNPAVYTILQTHNPSLYYLAKKVTSTTMWLFHPVILTELEELFELVKKALSWPLIYSPLMLDFWLLYRPPK